MRRVVVTGLGAISPFGVGVRNTWKRLLAGESAITSVANFEPQKHWKDLTSTVAGVVPSHGTGPEQWRPSDWLNATEQRRMSKFAQYAVACADMAMKDAAWKPDSQDDLEATGVCLGSGIGNLEEIYETSLAFNQQGYKKVSPLFVPKILINLAAGHVSMKYGLQGPNHAVTTACTTGAHSIGDAMRFIAFGDADVMVAGGTESCIHPLTFAGFGRARSLSTAYNHNPHASCRPFDRDRNGFVVSEGAAVLVLEELEHARARGAHIYAEVRGYGCSGDANHMTAPRDDGHGAFRAMKAALKNAKIPPADVSYVNAHATATQVGDVAEASAIRSIMTGEEGHADESQITVSSTKGAVGHLLGAAGAIEAMFAVLSVAEAIRAGMLAAAPKTMAASLTTNRLEALYGACAKPALYKISEQDRHNETVRMTEDGEEVGEAQGPWLEALDLQPSFSSWSQTTMLHMYIVLARLRCLDRDAAQALQHQFIDQFFFDCERMMHLNHGMTSSALRQRYLKEIFVQWRGLIAAYDEGIVKDDRVLGAAVWRNLFKSRENADMRQVAAVVAWIRASLRDVEAGAVEDLLVDPRTVFRRDLKDMFKLVDAFAPELKGEFGTLGAKGEELPLPEPVAERQGAVYEEVESLKEAAAKVL
ncbi:3-oxoacyl-[acyl-carrier-protein] reductase FabG [Colletotrichum sp. SAR 10_98]|nr:3-oxoacyl-[acyl-carrier-protein] reductase FabG [Colletotrichum sp. SAR 10_98]